MWRLHLQYSSRSINHESQIYKIPVFIRAHRIAFVLLFGSGAKYDFSVKMFFFTDSQAGDVSVN